jgi:F-type H+-transporting ATPase subunit b
MELDWSTFILEIINFLILVWILKRFLYQPILAVIARRRESVEKTLNEAQQLREEAETMQTQYRRRLSDWEQEKNQARDALQKELDAERARQREALQKMLAQQREKSRAQEERRLAELAQRKEMAALTLARRFTRRLLERLACPALEERIIALTLEELKQLPEERLSAYQNDATAPERIQISSAYPLSEAQRHGLQQTLDRLLKHSAHYDFCQNPSLIAGLRISLGPWIVQANLHEELQLFQEVARADPESSD